MPATSRLGFRQKVFERDDNTCVIPWCEKDAVDAHHVIERELWENGGYITKNGASVCSHHHRLAEGDLSQTDSAIAEKQDPDIPPQAFWHWANITSPPLPSETDTKHINKWGREFDTPPHEDLRDRIKYQSSRHLMPLYWWDESDADERIKKDDTQLKTLDPFIGSPLVITEKMDGGNCLVVNDLDTPVRARNGTSPTDAMRPLYRDGGLYWKNKVNQKLPDRYQVFGEWLLNKHSIHYGCDCTPKCDDSAPALSELTGVETDETYFQIFGVYDKIHNIWLSWPTTEKIADQLGFPTTPVIYKEDSADHPTYTTEYEARRDLTEKAHNIIANGGEGIVVRKKFPYHYGQFSTSLGKYVRENHVKDDAPHHSHVETPENKI